ncbi:MAG: MotA/TolQ/ExbB proton channel family protein [Candidatus Melainabacteria bacterium]|nr:MotA/TolQ/ExbB proton channel family protein [Candidatus Melainabacteria bacterium]
MELILFAIQHDWMVLLPILVCSIVTVGIFLERLYFYRQNNRDVVQFIHRLQRELQRGSLENAQILCAQLGGVIGEVAEEGVRILAEHKEGFDRAYDITTNLAISRLEKFLSVVGTIATISPYLGLFGTVVRILLTFGDLSKASNAAGAPQIMFGIGSALIATAFGLLVAIIAVALNNYFRSEVARYENDFQLLKLLFLSFAEQDGDVSSLQQATRSAASVNQTPGGFGRPSSSSMAAPERGGF